MEKLITAGELAKLACTTKRTIHYYDQKNILKPVRVDPQGYRYYRESQVLDYQMILLLQTYGVSLVEITNFVKTRRNLYQLFQEKKFQVQHKIFELQSYLNNIDHYMGNLKQNGTMVSPRITTVRAFEIFYIEKFGSYAQIGKYCSELSKMMACNEGKLTTMAIFEDPTYQPRQSRIKIAVLAERGVRIKRPYRKIVMHMRFAPGKVITWIHNGSGSLLSLFWKELEKYCRKNKISVRKDTPDFEIYREVNTDVTKQFFEIYLPIK